MENRLKLWSIGIFALSIILCSSTAFGGTIRVPTDQPTIQAGIDAAAAGDILLVADGTYKGEGNKNLNFKGKPITVQSDNGPDNCTIDCGGDGIGFQFHNGEGPDSVLSGFTITNGKAYYGGGIYCNNSGTSTGAPAVDINGNPRPSSTASPPDMGLMRALWR